MVDRSLVMESNKYAVQLSYTIWTRQAPVTKAKEGDCTHAIQRNATNPHTPKNTQKHTSHLYSSPTIQAGRAMPNSTARLPSGCPYFSQFSRVASSVRLRRERMEQETRERVCVCVCVRNRRGGGGGGGGV